MVKKDFDDRSLRQRFLAVFSVNDPKWGRGEGKDGNRPGQNRPPGEDGPPDLDEMWRDFNRRLSALFGRGTGGGGLGPLKGGRGGRFGAGLVIGVLVAIWLASGLFIVQEGQAGVVLQFGKYKYTTASGIQWRLPYPFASDEIVNMSQVRSIEIGRNTVMRSTNLKDSSVLTRDENIIDVRFAVQYRIKDATDFLFNNANPETNVTQAAETAVREIVGKNKMDYVLYEGREEVAQQLAQLIQKILDSYKTGILVTSVTMQNVQPPEQVQAAFDDAVKASQDRERQKNEAQAYANDVIPRARGAASRKVEEANGYASRVVATAQGDAARFDAIQAEYAKAPAVTARRMYLDTMQQVYADTAKVMIDPKAGSNVLVLPVDKLVQQIVPQKTADAPRAGADGTPTPPQGAASAAGTGDDALRSRDAFRTRDRQDDSH